MSPQERAVTWSVLALAVALLSFGFVVVAVVVGCGAK